MALHFKNIEITTELIFGGTSMFYGNIKHSFHKYPYPFAHDETKDENKKELEGGILKLCECTWTHMHMCVFA